MMAHYCFCRHYSKLVVGFNIPKHLKLEQLVLSMDKLEPLLMCKLYP